MVESRPFNSHQHPCSLITEPHLSVSFIAHKCSVPPNEPYSHYLASFFSRYLETCFWYCSYLFTFDVHIFKAKLYLIPWSSVVYSRPLGPVAVLCELRSGSLLASVAVHVVSALGKFFCIAVPNKKRSNQMQWINSPNFCTDETFGKHLILSRVSCPFSRTLGPNGFPLGCQALSSFISFAFWCWLGLALAFPENYIIFPLDYEYYLLSHTEEAE